MILVAALAITIPSASALTGMYSWSGFCIAMEDDGKTTAGDFICHYDIAEMSNGILRLEQEVPILDNKVLDMEQRITSLEQENDTVKFNSWYGVDCTTQNGKWIATCNDINSQNIRISALESIVEKGGIPPDVVYRGFNVGKAFRTYIAPYTENVTFSAQYKTPEATEWISNYNVVRAIGTTYDYVYVQYLPQGTPLEIQICTENVYGKNCSHNDATFTLIVGDYTTLMPVVLNTIIESNKIGFNFDTSNPSVNYSVSSMDISGDDGQSWINVYNSDWNTTHQTVYATPYDITFVSGNEYQIRAYQENEQGISPPTSIYKIILS